MFIFSLPTPPFVCNRISRFFRKGRKCRNVIYLHYLLDEHARVAFKIRYAVSFLSMFYLCQFG